MPTPELAVGPTTLLYLLQVAGPAFPTGAFAHSLGFETLIVDGAIASAAEFAEVAGDWLETGLGPVDGAAVAIAHSARETELLVLDQLLDALKPPREAQEASVKIGMAFMRAAETIGAGPALGGYVAAVSDGSASGHGAPAFALACRDAGVPRQAAVLAYLQSTFANLALVVARLVPLGQVEIQRVIANASGALMAATERALEAGVDDLAGATPWLDVAAMRHEHLHTRLCIS